MSLYASILGHISELRKRLFWCLLWSSLFSVLVFSMYDTFLALLLKPIHSINSSVSDKLFFVNSFYEGFTTKFKFSFILGIVLAFPVHLYHGLKFIFPGLRSIEKKVIVFSLMASFFLSLFCLWLCYFQLLPFSIDFLISRHFIPSQVGVLLNFNQNIFYIINFILYSLLVFQLPIVLEILMYFNILSVNQVWKSTKYVIVGIFVLTAIVTPPDVISQVMLAVPLIAFFLVTLLIAKLFGFGKEST